MAVTRGKGGEGRLKRSQTPGDGRRELWLVNTEPNIQMMHYRIVPLKPI